MRLGGSQDRWSGIRKQRGQNSYMRVDSHSRKENNYQEKEKEKKWRMEIKMKPKKSSILNYQSWEDGLGLFFKLLGSGSKNSPKSKN